MLRSSSSSSGVGAWLGRPQEATDPPDEVAAGLGGARTGAGRGRALARRQLELARDDVVRHAVFLDLAAVGVLRPRLRKRVSLDRAHGRDVLDAHGLDNERGSDFHGGKECTPERLADQVT